MSNPNPAPNHDQQHSHTKHNNVGLEYTVSYLEAVTFIRRTMDQMYQESIVLVESKIVMPRLIRYGIVALVYSGILVLFIYFAVIRYQEDRGNKFISLESDAGECSTVSKQLTGTFLASTEGLWESQLGFNYTTALYSFQFTNATYDDYNEYAQFMTTVQEGFESAGYFSSISSLTTNLVYLVAGTFPITVNGNVQVVQLTGAPSVIYNRKYISANLIQAPPPGGTVYRTCNASYYDAVFDPSTSKFQLAYDAAEFVESDCQALMSIPQFFGFIPSVQSTLLLELDMISFSIAWALNYGMINPDELEEIQPKEGVEVTLFVNGTTYIFRQYFDIRYPGMTPIGCLSPISGVKSVFNDAMDHVCFVELLNTFVLPIINPMGGKYNNSEPVATPCTCDGGFGVSSTCNAFSFMISALYYSQSPENGILDCVVPLLNLYFSYFNFSATTAYRPYEKLNEDAYLAQYYSDASIAYQQELNTLDFCGFNCSLLTFFAGDEYNQAASIYYYQLLNGSCINLFESTNWAPLVETAPQPLTESYYSCQMKREPAISDALGISFANVSLILFLVPYGFFPIIFFLLNCFKHEVEEYDDVDRKEALKMFANELLKDRDRKYPGSNDNSRIEGGNDDMAQLIHHLVKTASDSRRGLRDVSIDSQRSMNLNPLGVELRAIQTNENDNL